jgi:hypothetical protein
MRHPTTQKIRLIPLLPVAAKTTLGATKIPVPTILFRIKALSRSIKSYHTGFLVDFHIIAYLVEIVPRWCLSARGMSDT